MLATVTARGSDEAEPRAASATGRSEADAPVLQMRLRGLRKEYDTAVAVAGLDLDVPRGAFVSLLGPSGCGKTTTLRMIAGLVRPTEGRIFINNRDVTDLPPRKRRLAMVFQQFALFPHLTVAKNVAFGLRMQRIAPKERQSRVQAALELVQMADLAERWPSS
jgi:putative spermidine/putrescine transport system ATP-binding protein